LRGWQHFPSLLLKLGEFSKFDNPISLRPFTKLFLLFFFGLGWHAKKNPKPPNKNLVCLQIYGRMYV
jgi:hypothetical protein